MGRMCWWGQQSLPMPGIEPQSTSPYPVMGDLSQFILLNKTVLNIETLYVCLCIIMKIASGCPRDSQYYVLYQIDSPFQLAYLVAHVVVWMLQMPCLWLTDTSSRLASTRNDQRRYEFKWIHVMWNTYVDRILNLCSRSLKNQVLIVEPSDYLATSS